MTKSIILSTGNIVSAGPSIIRKPGTDRSNPELTNSLRSNILAAKEEYASIPVDHANGNANGHANGNGNGSAADHHPPTHAWTAEEDNVLYVPRIDWDAAGGLQEEPSRYDITAKLFFLTAGSAAPPATRERHARQALDLVRRELRIGTVDLLVISFPGMSFEGDCEWEADKQNAGQGDDESETAAWRLLGRLQREGLVRRLGIAEFGTAKLARLLCAAAETGVPPAVDQINIRNCCNVPPPLAKLAREHDVDLLVHNDSTDVLPAGTLRELLGPGPGGAGVLADGGSGGGLKGELTPQWVVKYTAVVRDRGVIENKGYFAGAELEEA